MLIGDDPEDGSLSNPSPRHSQVAWDEDGARLYAIACGNRVKVGVSYDPERRVKGIAAGEKLPARVIGSVPVPPKRALTAESYAHWLLRERHDKGEWFNAEHHDAMTAIETSAADVGSGKAVPAFVRTKYRNGKPVYAGVMISPVDRSKPAPLRASRLDMED